ncbi:MAG: hypothetical protein PHN19_04170 [Patescibacteria group bacterium]|nr:hypothetical protein [Patescibacteria group bacterium]
MFKKLSVLFLILALFITYNATLLTVKKADAIPTVVVSDVPRDTADRIGITVWKAAVYPLVRDMVLSFVSTGDFKLSWNNVKDWLIHDLAFQTANAILQEYVGFNLCATIGADIRVALLQMYDDTGFAPDCTFDQSQLAQTAEKLFSGDSEQAWQDVKNYYYQNFHFSLYGEANQFGTWFKLRDNINTQINQRQQNIRFEMLINEGFLGNYDCSGVPESQRPDNCRVVSPGAVVAELVKSSVRDPMDSALKAQMINDVAALAGVVTDMMKNKFIYSIYDKL